MNLPIKTGLLRLFKDALLLVFSTGMSSETQQKEREFFKVRVYDVVLSKLRFMLF